MALFLSRSCRLRTFGIKNRTTGKMTSRAATTLQAAFTALSARSINRIVSDVADTRETRETQSQRTPA